MYNCRKTSKDTLLDTVSTQLGFYISETPVKFGITPKNCDDANHCLIDDETAVHGDNVPTLSDVYIERILQNAMLSTDIIRNLSRIPGSYGTLSSRLIPFMSRVPSLFFSWLKDY